MKFSLSNMAPHQVPTPCLVVGVAEDVPPSGAAAAVDRASDGLLTALLESRDIDANRGHTTLLHRLPGLAAERVLVVGCGKPDKFDRVRFDRVCLAAGKFLRDHAVTEAHVCLHDMSVETLDANWRLQHAAIAFDRANYLYTTTKALKDDSPVPLRAASFQGEPDQQPVLDRAAGIAAGYRRARELGNLPANICNPAYLAQQARAIAEQYANTEIEVLNREAMAELGMDALLGVAQGSENGPRLIVLQYRGAAEGERPYVFVGKGITFDSGGISLKPGPNMDQMKFDMCGAAAVIGAFEACAAMQLPVNLVAVVAAAENMPDGKSYRPGDVLTSMSGKTIEILNTDAEGRLVLCDALTYCEKFDPLATIDVATLTGACVVALGHHASGLMSKHDDLADELLQAGRTAVDRAWRLPIWEDYQSQLKTPFADLKNVGGMPAGAITAGCFLASFAKKQRWAHLDIAGSAWKWAAAEGATGRPVGLLTQFLIDRAG
jgi:leucyl aminopeptidase